MAIVAALGTPLERRVAFARLLRPTVLGHTHRKVEEEQVSACNVHNTCRLCYFMGPCFNCEHLQTFLLSVRPQLGHKRAVAVPAVLRGRQFLRRVPLCNDCPRLERFW
jgi:hypothetical protein